MSFHVGALKKTENEPQICAHEKYHLNNTLFDIDNENL